MIEYDNRLSIGKSTGHFNNFIRMAVNDFQKLIITIYGPTVEMIDTDLMNDISSWRVLRQDLDAFYDFVPSIIFLFWFIKMPLVLGVPVY